MKQIVYKFFILFFTFSVITSCNQDDFLEQVNPNELAKESFWKDLSDTDRGLNAVYKTLHHPAVLNIIPEILRSDMGYPGFGRPVPQNTEEFYNHSYTASSDEISGKWETNYVGIFRANQVIEALESLKGTVDEVEWTSQMAQARFFRGLFHFYLHTTYNSGSIIIRDFVPLTKEDFSKPLSPANEVLEFIRKDLEYAYVNLYKKGEYPNNDVTRITSGAAATILGTSYLYELDYDKAMIYFDDVINNHGYELEDNMDLLFTTAGEYNKESIFEINFTADNIQIDLDRWIGETGTNWLNQQTSGTRGPNGPAWIAYAYKTEPMDPLDVRNYYQDPIAGLTLRPVPLRASSMMAIAEDSQTPYYLDITASEYPRIQGKTWGFAWWKKYTNHDIATSESTIPAGQATLSSKNVTLNRLADVLLMQAECKIKTGSIGDAINLMNEIRKRWGLVLLGPSNGDGSSTYDDVNYDATSLMQHLMRVEKPLEMGAEGHAIRFLDFQRWKKSDNYGFRDRLTELSNLVFYGDHLTYIDREGVQKTKFNFPRLLLTDPGTNNRPIVDYEYDIPALNYDEAKHGTYPIPFVESSTNTNIN